MFTEEEEAYNSRIFPHLSKVNAGLACMNQKSCISIFRFEFSDAKEGSHTNLGLHPQVNASVACMILVYEPAFQKIIACTASIRW